MVRVAQAGLILALGVLLVAPVHARPPRPPRGMGDLIITCHTKDARVLLDGKEVGTVPLPGPLTLKAGKYTLKLFKRGFTEFIDVVTIRSRRVHRVDIDLLPVAGIVNVTANVEDARVFVDEKFLGQTPLEAEMPGGKRKVKVTRGGYRDYVKELQVVAGEVQSLDVTLEELPPEENPFRPAPPPPLRWYEKWWWWAVIAGGTSVLAVSIALPAYYLSRDPVDTFNPQFCWGVGTSCR